jgi:ribonuclease HI
MVSTKQEIQWQRMQFKSNKVWMATMPDGQALIQKGKALIKYQLDQTHEYWVHPQNIRPLDADPADSAASAKPLPTAKKPTPTPKNPSETSHDASNAIHIFTDGASSGNPGPAGIGVVLRYGSHEKEITRFIGMATNNIAELEAIRISLNEVKDTQLPVRLFTDSAYAQGVLTFGWKAKKNQSLIETIKARMADFKDLKLIKVKGHAGEEGNERADHLATSAIKRGR